MTRSHETNDTFKSMTACNNNNSEFKYLQHFYQQAFFQILLLKLTFNAMNFEQTVRFRAKISILDTFHKTLRKSDFS